MPKITMTIHGHNLRYKDSETPEVAVTASTLANLDDLSYHDASHLNFTVDPYTARDFQVGAKIVVTVERDDA